MQAPSRKDQQKRLQVSSKQNQLQQGNTDKSNVNTTPLSGLVDAPDAALKDKLQRLRALHAKWEYEDELEVVEGAELVFRHKTRCKDVGAIFFGFALHEGQIDTIWTLFYERRDLLLLAKTGFGKSLIFQLLPFMTLVAGVVVVLMPLKLLQAEQSGIINTKLPNGHAIELNGDNNKESTQREIARGYYTHVFTSPEIALSKKFKKNVLDQHLFSDRLCLLAVDEIHLVEEWGKQFRPLYAEIEKVRKRIPTDVPLVGVSATLTPDVQTRVIKKAGFYPTYKLMQTSLDRLEIMQVHRFMKHMKSSCLDLQFLLPKVATQAKDIQETIVFANSVSDIRPMISIIQAWMKLLGYQEASYKWIRPYYFALSDWDKGLTAAAFAVAADENEECVILVATDAYGMDINNPDVKLVVQWDIPLSFDSMIQRMGRAGFDENWANLCTEKIISGLVGYKCINYPMALNHQQ